MICQRWSADGRVPVDGYKDCQYFGILIGVVVGIKHANGDVWDEWIRWMRRRGFEMTNWKEIVRVMGREAEEEKGGTELIQSFTWLTSRIAGNG